MSIDGALLFSAGHFSFGVMSCHSLVHNFDLINITYREIPSTLSEPSVMLYTYYSCLYLPYFTSRVLAPGRSLNSISFASLNPFVSSQDPTTVWSIDEYLA